ncbi:NAD(P)/FAD-dependent oxidoreductase [bacterium]|nr:NAD(P)/FAD-dependent oxidoreductase [bacterium]
MVVQQPRIVIIGAGFGGLYAARALAKQDVEVLLIDRNNFHTFTPLLYQVATCGLDSSEIAYPVRSIFRKNPNVHFMLGEVLAITPKTKSVSVRTNGTVREESYDYLIVSAGSVTNFFNNDALAQFSYGIKDLGESVELRNHILRLFEKAAWAKDDMDYRNALTTMVVVGGGPTGLEMAGALFELYNHVLRHEYSKDRELHARVILIEAMDHLLAPYPESLQQSALEQLESMGVEVMLGQMVDDVGPDYVRLKTGETIKTHTLVWAAGVKASPLAEMLGVELQRGGRVPIETTIRVIGHDDIYVAGDMSYLINPKNDRPYPQVIPVAQQQGRLAAKNIIRRIKGEEEQDFKYSDRGIMATIGRSHAVAWIFYRIKLTGYLAWLSWLVLHIVTLMGFRNRVNVFVNWLWNYLTYDRSVRIILEARAKA